MAIDPRIPTYPLLTYGFSDVEVLKSLPPSVFLSKRFHTLQAFHDGWLYTFELSVDSPSGAGCEAEADSAEDTESPDEGPTDSPSVTKTDEELVQTSTLLPMSRELVGEVDAEGVFENDPRNFLPPTLFGEFFEKYEYGGFIFTGDVLENLDLLSSGEESDSEKILVDYDGMLSTLEAESKIVVSTGGPSSRWFGKDPRDFSFVGPETELSDSSVENGPYIFDCLGTTACEHITERFIEVYLEGRA